MRVQSPIEDFAKSVTGALLLYLPDETYERTTHKNKIEGETLVVATRPSEYHITDIKTFYQEFGSTATIFGGIGGAAMTTSLMVVVETAKTAAVFCDGRHAYNVPRDSEKWCLFQEDIKKGRLTDVKDAEGYYGALYNPEIQKFVEALRKYR